MTDSFVFDNEFGDTMSVKDVHDQQSHLAYCRQLARHYKKTGELSKTKLKQLFREECERNNIKTKYVKFCPDCIKVVPYREDERGEPITELCPECNQEMAFERRIFLCW